MKPVTLLLIAFVFMPAPLIAQTAKQPFSTDLDRALPVSQAGCPVAFTNVSLENPARLMPVNQYDVANNSSLSFQYRNQSRKQILSIDVQIELRVKRSIYDLDTTSILMNQTLTGRETGKLPLTTHAYSLGRVTLQKVSYVDGTIWTANEQSPCRYEASGGAQEIGELR
ncbi:MAG TPA: hypothetical protein VHB45_00300 [Alloacidobacterium sp.]|nr:hypothetical protein [Alloacidobacterium sp.]